MTEAYGEILTTENHHHHYHHHLNKTHYIITMHFDIFYLSRYCRYWQAMVIIVIPTTIIAFITEILIFTITTIHGVPSAITTVAAASISINCCQQHHHLFLHPNSCCHHQYHHHHHHHRHHQDHQNISTSITVS